MDESNRLGVQTTYSCFNFVNHVMQYLEFNQSKKAFEVALGFITRAALSNPVHMKEIEVMLPKYSKYISTAVMSENDVIASDAISLINQYLMIGQNELVLEMISRESLLKALQNKRYTFPRNCCLKCYSIFKTYFQCGG